MMDLEVFILSEVTQRKNIIIRYHSHVEFHFKKVINGLIYKTETYRYQKQIYGYQRGNVGRVKSKFYSLVFFCFYFMWVHFVSLISFFT